jgi:hypothetical protein
MSATGLYPQILERHWDALAEPLRGFYAGAASAHATGRLDIERGASAPGRLLAWLWGMPPRGAQIATVLRVERSGARETWSRRFGAHAWKTHQQPGPAGSLAERRGPIEVWMRLSCADGALCFASFGGALCIARWRVPLPAWTLPQVDARSWSLPGERGIHLDVTLRAARVGLVARYSGSVCAAQDAAT